jgi:hypothetical protein
LSKVSSAANQCRHAGSHHSNIQRTGSGSGGLTTFHEDNGGLIKTETSSYTQVVSSTEGAGTSSNTGQGTGLTGDLTCTNNNGSGASANNALNRKRNKYRMLGTDLKRKAVFLVSTDAATP